MLCFEKVTSLCNFVRPGSNPLSWVDIPAETQAGGNVRGSVRDTYFCLQPPAGACLPLQMLPRVF